LIAFVADFDGKIATLGITYNSAKAVSSTLIDLKPGTLFPKKFRISQTPTLSSPCTVTVSFAAGQLGETFVQSV